MTVRVAFEVSCPTINSEEVRLVGSLPALGSWDPFNGVPLTTTEKQYPVWCTAEIVMPSGADMPEVVYYKYVKIFSGSAVQWEVGPNRLLQPSTLAEGVNYIEDVMYDIDEILARRNSGVRIHFQETLEKMPTKSLSASRLASSVPSPLPTASQGQTPIEKSPSLQGLDHILRELQELEPTHRMGKLQIQRAIVAVRSAIEAERSAKAGSGRRCRNSNFAAGSLLMVPLLPLMVALAILWRYPEVHSSRWKALREQSASWRSSWSWTCVTLGEDPLIRGIRRGRAAVRAQGRGNYDYPR